MKRALALLVFCIMAAAPAPSRAQSPTTRYATEKWVVDRWTSDQGLPQNTVTQIRQTDDGYIWLATFGGLVRFDGVRFTPFTTLNYAGLGSDRLRDLETGARGDLWIGTEHGFVRMHDGKFQEWTAKDGRPRGLPMGLLVEGDTVFIATAAGGLARFSDGRFETFGERGIPPGHAGRAVRDRDGNLWSDRSGGRIVLMKRGADRFEPVQLRTGNLVALHAERVDRGGRLWFRTNRSDAIWDGTTLRETGLRGLVVDDGHGGHWFANARMLHHRDSSGVVSRVDAPRESGIAGIRAMFVDRDGTLWLGTESHGLLRVRRRLFHMYGLADGLANEQVTAIMRDNRGRLWIGSSCGRTTILEKGQWRSFRDPGCLFSLAQTTDGTIWGGSYGDGVHRIAPDGGYRALTNRDGLPHNIVLALHADPDTSLWIGTENGLAHLAHGAFRTYRTESGLPSNQIRYVTRDRAGALWTGTEGGIARLDGERFTAWTQRDGLPRHSMRAIYQDAESVYWIGTYGGGLVRADPDLKRFTIIDTRHGLCDNVASAVLEDQDGYLWMSGNRGVYRAHRRDLNAFARGEVPQVLCDTYGLSDGLLTVETNGGFQPSAWQDRDGRLWFATVRGLATVHPRDALPHSQLPALAIEALLVDGREQSIASTVKLPVENRSIEVRYTGLTSIAPELLVFRYQMEGLDTSWTYVNARRTAYYSRLEPGRYRFVVSAAGRGGRWNEAGQSLSLVVPTPWFSTLWFRSLATLAILSAAALAVRTRLAHVHAQRDLERQFSRQLLLGQENERRRLAGELHDSLGQELFVMKNRAEMAMRGAVAAPARAHLEEISRAASHAVQTARDISHGLRPHLLDHFGLGPALEDLAAHTSIAGEIAIELDVKDAALLTGDAATQAYRIVQEALNNVVKHAQARHVSITMRAVRGVVHMVISDDGRGFDRAADGFGLSGMKQRARLLGGTFEVQSEEARGTSLTITLPLSPSPSNAHE